MKRYNLIHEDEQTEGQKNLIDELYSFAEEHLGFSWMQGFEFTLWEDLTRSDKRDLNTTYVEGLERIRILAGRENGWVVFYPFDSKSKVFHRDALNVDLSYFERDTQGLCFVTFDDFESLWKDRIDRILRENLLSLMKTSSSFSYVEKGKIGIGKDVQDHSIFVHFVDLHEGQTFYYDPDLEVEKSVDRFLLLKREYNIGYSFKVLAPSFQSLFIVNSSVSGETLKGMLDSSSLSSDEIASVIQKLQKQLEGKK